MSRKRQRKGRSYSLALILLVILLLSSCARVSYNCPTYPIAGAKVAKELEQADDEHYPYTWEWIARINKLREELEQCNK